MSRRWVALMKLSRVNSVALLACAVVLALTTLAHACNVPVFRYALERWPSGNFEAFVFHRGAWSGEEQKQVEALKTHALDSHANLVIKDVDLAESHGLD